MTIEELLRARADARIIDELNAINGKDLTALFAEKVAGMLVDEDKKLPRTGSRVYSDHGLASVEFANVEVDGEHADVTLVVHAIHQYVVCDGRVQAAGFNVNAMRRFIEHMRKLLGVAIESWNDDRPSTSFSMRFRINITGSVRGYFDPADLSKSARDAVTRLEDDIRQAFDVLEHLYHVLDMEAFCALVSVMPPRLQYCYRERCE